MKKRSGFTLIELLVVIAILALLMAILMPALRKVRKQARFVVCQANLKDWGLIFGTYVSDNDGKFFSGANPVRGTYWPLQLPTAMQNWKSNETWFCPTATKPVADESDVADPPFSIFNAWGIYTSNNKVNEYSYPEYGIAGSYGLNGYLLRITAKTYESGVPSSCGWQNFPLPAYVPVMLDALNIQLWPTPYQGPANNESEFWGGTGMGRACIDRHIGFVGGLFGDGSSHKVGLKELWTLKWHKEFETDGPWTLAGGVSNDDWPEWLSRYKDY